MYVVGRNNAVIALDADTGKQRWSRALPATPTNRGFNYWESKDRSDRRLIFAVDSMLRQIDARTGELVTSFGSGGSVDLRVGIPRAAICRAARPAGCSRISSSSDRPAVNPTAHLQATCARST